MVGTINRSVIVAASIQCGIASCPNTTLLPSNISMIFEHSEMIKVW